MPTPTPENPYENTSDLYRFDSSVGSDDPKISRSSSQRFLQREANINPHQPINPEITTCKICCFITSIGALFIFVVGGVVVYFS
jgi:hypothetical protein